MMAYIAPVISAVKLSNFAVIRDNLVYLVNSNGAYKKANINITRMWANAQRDGHPAEYRWHPLFNAAKFG